MVEKHKHIARYCDEAGKDTDRYLAVGGLIVNGPKVSMARDMFEHAKRRHGINGEVKWNYTK